MAVKIECAYTERVKLKNLKPNPLNPNYHPPEQVKLIAKIINEVGWRDPITVSKRSGFIVRGHGRFAAAALLKMATVPVEYHDYKSEEDEIADLVADNKIKELSYLDPARTKDLLINIEDSSLRAMTGFSSSEVEKIMAGGSGAPPGSGGGGRVEGGKKTPQGGSGAATVGKDAPASKYYKLPMLMSVKDRDFILAAVSKYQRDKEMNLSSEAFMRMIADYEGNVK